ncbi:hypothetical protein BDV35DRAFT_373867 [Aspergillus flavus]|uniref:Uncharacterized protein n=1 Tax=Aspergillus flavus TaxID=5059 RepID=A0A5N6GD54_ASPFL|nr:hypothetical protein BDV35DRAFT_373867 [Aspergillus flavus]
MGTDLFEVRKSINSHALSRLFAQQGQHLPVSYYRLLALSTECSLIILTVAFFLASSTLAAVAVGIRLCTFAAEVRAIIVQNNLPHGARRVITVHGVVLFAYILGVGVTGLAGKFTKRNSLQIFLYICGVTLVGQLSLLYIECLEPSRSSDLETGFYGTQSGEGQISSIGVLYVNDLRWGMGHNSGYNRREVAGDSCMSRYSRASCVRYCGGYTQVGLKCDMYLDSMLLRLTL